MAEVNLNQLVTEVIDLYRAQVVGRGLTLEVRLAPEVTRLVGDRGRLRQLLHNLLTNAVEALEGKPGGSITVATRLVQRNGEDVVEIVVEDNGPGFQRDLIGQVFDPYVTTKPRGTGLGLAIVRKIVEEHGGHVEADNRTDGGALVRVELPPNETTRAQAAQREVRRPVEPRKERA
jgi:signal transduction histidine kinase